MSGLPPVDFARLGLAPTEPGAEAPSATEEVAALKFSPTTYDPYAAYDEEQKQYLKSQDNPLSALKHFAGEAASELLFGLPRTVYDKFIADDRDRKELEAYDATHIADNAGAAVGTIGNLIGTAGLLGGTARATRAGLGLAEAAGSGFVRRAAGEAVEQGVINLPRMGADTFTQSPDAAVSNYLLNVGTGAVFGGVLSSKLAQSAAAKGDSLVTQAVGKLDDFAQENQKAITHILADRKTTAQTNRLLKLAGGKDAMEDFLQNNADVLNAPDMGAAAKTVSERLNFELGQLQQAGSPLAAEKALEVARVQGAVKALEHIESLGERTGVARDLIGGSFKAGLLSAAYHVNPMLAFMGRELGGQPLGSVLKSAGAKAFDKFLGTEMGQRLATATAEVLKENTDQLITRAINSSTTRYVLPNLDEVYRSMGIDSKDPHASTTVAAQMQDRIDSIPSKGLRPEAQTALKQQMRTTTDYIQSITPKPPLPDPLRPQTGPWRPTRAEQRTFADKLSVVANPLLVVDHLKSGMLNKNHIEALEKTNPVALEQIRNKVVMQLANDKNFARQMQHRRNALNMLMGAPSQTTQAPQMNNNSPSKGMSQAGLKTIEPQTDASRIAGT